MNVLEEYIDHKEKTIIECCDTCETSFWCEPCFCEECNWSLKEDLKKYKDYKIIDAV